MQHRRTIVSVQCSCCEAGQPSLAQDGTSNPAESANAFEGSTGQPSAAHPALGYVHGLYVYCPATTRQLAKLIDRLLHCEQVSR